MAEPTEKKEPWLNYLALTTVILAVCATLATFKGGGFSTKSVISQAQASDQWAYYQAKSLKQYLYELQRERLQLDLATMPADRLKSCGPQFQASVAHHSQEIVRYSRERSDIERKARALERVRDEAQLHSYWFGLAVIFLQVAILLSSIAALLKRMVLWAIGSAVGAVGILLFLNGFLLFWNPQSMPVPEPASSHSPRASTAVSSPDRPPLVPPTGVSSAAPSTGPDQAPLPTTTSPQPGSQGPTTPPSQAVQGASPAP